MANTALLYGSLALSVLPFMMQYRIVPRDMFEAMHKATAFLCPGPKDWLPCNVACTLHLHKVCISFPDPRTLSTAVRLRFA